MAKSFKDAPSISRILLKLIANGFINKQVHEEDKRLFKIQLTEEGRNIVSILNPEVVKLRNIGLASFDDDEVSSLLDKINRIFDNYSK